jgi:hypothetical protein
MVDSGVPNGSDSVGARVVLVVPTSWEWYFEPEKKGSIAWCAERSLRMAEKISPGQGIDVFLYGEPKSGDGTEVIRTRLERTSLPKWIADWAVRPNMKRGLFSDAAPANEVEKRLGVADSPWFGLPLPAVQAVCKENASRGGATLVLFWLDRMAQAEEMVRFIAKESGPAVLWQFFGDPDDISYAFWTKDGLHQGKVLPQVRFHLSRRWRWRAVLRTFSRWSQEGQLR